MAHNRTDDAPDALDVPAALDAAELALRGLRPFASKFWLARLTLIDDGRERRLVGGGGHEQTCVHRHLHDAGETLPPGASPAHGA